MMALSERETPAPFNMAIDTLQRLGEILREIKQVSTLVLEDAVKSQTMKLDLVKQFFLNAIPLLHEDVIEKYKDKIIDLKPAVQKIPFDARRGERPKGTMIVHSPMLDNLLNNYLLELQSELQKNRYFMPSSKDPRFSWGQGD
tara:strand:+ start:426 stop:854 length:429 start_codon:yes stop_codon:yes gene_type:complete